MTDTGRGERRTELERRAAVHDCPLSDGAAVRVLEFDFESGRRRPTMLVIPGFASAFQSWDEVVGHFARDFRVLYFESREKSSCRMPTRRVERSVTLARMAQDLGEVTRHFELDGTEYVALSSSTGGTLQVHASSAGRTRPTACILVGPAIEHRLSKWAAFGTSILPESLRLLAIPFYRLHLWNVHVRRDQHPEQYAKYVRAAEQVRVPRIRRLLWEMTRHDAWDLLPKVTPPCLVVGARDDGMHATTDCRRTAELLPNAEYVELSDNNATHSLPLVEVTHTFLDRLGFGSTPSTLERRSSERARRAVEERAVQ